MDNTRRFGRLIEGSNPSGGTGKYKNMKKLFLIIILGGFFVPFIVAAGVYSIYVPKLDETFTVTHSGIVPCGVCVEVNPMAPAAEPSCNSRGECKGECNQEIGGVPVPEGTPVPKKFVYCTICHFFVMIDGALDFILLKLIPPIGTLLLIFGGISLYQAGANPEKLTWAKKFLTSVIIGLLLLYMSWVIVNSVFTALGVASWVGFGQGWFQISCEIKAHLF